MRLGRIVIVVAGLWVLLIAGLHVGLNLPDLWPRKAGSTQPFRIGFLPVTCHLTCPVTDFINKQLSGQSEFEPIRFQSWPELKEAFLSNTTQGCFILAPLAMKLREEGVPIKIIYLGHRDGSAMVVHRDSQIFTTADLRGRTIAVPNRFSNQWLLVYKVLQDRGISLQDVKIVELPPPDMPAALLTHSVDAITSGEPFMGQAELDGYGRVLYQVKDVWPNFISCVLAVNESVIQSRRATVQRLVDGIARSGLWLDKDMNHRMEAAQFVSKNYYNQNPRLLQFVLSKPPDRVRYTELTPLKADFQKIENLGQQTGLLRGKASFEDYTDPSFAAAVPAGQRLDWDYRP